MTGPMQSHVAEQHLGQVGPSQNSVRQLVLGSSLGKDQPVLLQLSGSSKSQCCAYGVASSLSELLEPKATVQHACSVAMLQHCCCSYHLGSESLMPEEACDCIVDHVQVHTKLQWTGTS